MSLHPAAPSLLDAKATVPDHVVHRAFASEMVILNLKTGRYHGLNPVAGRMLEVLGAATTVRDAAAQIAEEYGQPLADVEADVLRLCAELVERELLEVDVQA
jgi:hypothetical protein